MTPVIVGPMPCIRCKRLVVFARIVAGKRPHILDADTRQYHVCAQ